MRMLKRKRRSIIQLAKQQPRFATTHLPVVLAMAGKGGSCAFLICIAVIAVVVAVMTVQHTTVLLNLLPVRLWIWLLLLLLLRKSFCRLLLVRHSTSLTPAKNIGQGAVVTALDQWAFYLPKCGKHVCMCLAGDEKWTAPALFRELHFLSVTVLFSVDLCQEDWALHRSQWWSVVDS